ncbi:hypothetical protein LTR56_015744 [Elasticomyces elasticus]|nr:hypothetical protein LTR56_015744 [Elasticomyces elasticus]KAK3661955.1 hypothetical protein LTR22_007126 [Elasticomyces elasticus]KAK4933122.1 hypothetical protein LTR49_000606 [Elasticomyces elasticus]KAK5755865.1 hypothetical protein LTS12_013982 [Elasticomyces elasticus]
MPKRRGKKPRARQQYNPLPKHEWTHDGYDFGSGMALPGATYIKKEPGWQNPPTFNVGAGIITRNSPFRRFFHGNNTDRELLSYLDGRNISPGFLAEVDQFLASHPEIGKYVPDFVNSINARSPVEAYKFFLKGYTRPARYIEGVLPDLSRIPLPQVVVPIANIYDTELHQFFEGHEYRVDILMRIDEVVLALCKSLYHGDYVTYAQRKLVVYTLFGNVVDAFKFYEYNYQEEWLHHRYLPEHVILSELPKRQSNTQPLDRIIDDGRYAHSRSHRATRDRILRATEQNVDMFEVLLEEFTGALCRKGLRRVDIETMRREALATMDDMRANGDIRDVVDVVMGRAGQVAQVPKRTTHGLRRQVAQGGSRRLAKIDKLQRTLHQLEAQEQSMFNYGDVAGFNNVTAMRQRVEREFVMAVVHYAENTGRMTRREGDEWHALYRREKQEQREMAGQRFNVHRYLARFM